MTRPALLLAALLLAPAGAALAGPTACPANFAGGSAPELRKDTLAARATELCYPGFAVLHSGLTRTPLWSAEHLTRDRVAAARRMDRVNTFHADARLPAADRAELSDYQRSGYDRGHMAPSGDMPDAESQDASFTLANMIPQDPSNNRNLWADIESAVRDLVQREGEAYVVTGPLFEGARLSSLKGRVIVPTSVYKAVYLPRSGAAAAYVAANDASGSWELVSLDALRGRSGIEIFPGLPAAASAAVASLPSPAARGGGQARGERPSREAEAAHGGWGSLGYHLLKEAVRHWR